MHPAELLRKTGQTPVIDIGTIAAIKADKIKVVKAIKRFDKRTVQFTDRESAEIDAVILATGYRAKIEDFIEKGELLLDKKQLPNKVIAEGYHKGLFFLGFDNYKLGGLLGTIQTDSKTIVEAVR